MKWDDQYRQLLKDLVEKGTPIQPHKGSGKELIGHQFTLEAPRDRCTLNGARNLNIFQAVGHWLWIMAGRMDLGSISYYNPQARKFSVDLTKTAGAYGPRLFGIGVYDQIHHCIDLIKKRSATRRAVAAVYLPQLDFYREPIEDREDEVPCTIALQFMPRGQKLHALTYMRSQDALMLLPLDVFIFTLIQEYVASSTGKEMGSYYHTSGSFHFYEEKRPLLEKVFTSQGDDAPLMPSMPNGNQEDHLRQTLALEERIRVSAFDQLAYPGRKKYNPRDFLDEAEELPDFWKMMVHCLVVMAALRAGDQATIKRVLGIVHKSMQPYVRRAHMGKSVDQLLDSYDFFLKS